MKRTQLQRRTPIRKRRPGTRRGQPTTAEKSVLRALVYERSGGMCELRMSPKCLPGVLPYDGSIYERWHLVHNGAKRRFGWPTEGERRMRGGCYWCHIDELHRTGGKIPCD